jgi:hypothetical protein
MRLRLMATYLGAPYQAGLGPDGTQAILLSPGPPPADLGFTASAGNWCKQVSVAELEDLWLSRPEGEYRGEPCLVLDDLGDRLHIAYLGRDAARAAQLGYWEIDREVFEVVVARHEVISLAERRVDFPLTAAMFAPPEYAAGTGRAQTAESARSEAGTETGAAAGPHASTEAGTEAGTGAGPEAGPEAGTAADAETRPKDDPGAAENDVLAGHDGPAGPGHLAGDGWLAGYDGPGQGPHGPERMAAWHGSPEPWPGPATPVRDTAAAWVTRKPGPGGPPQPWTEPEPAAEPGTSPAAGPRTGRKDRVSPESVFAELLSLAAIPHTAYAVDEEVPGAMCLVEADGGFEVFSRTDDARLEVKFFADEEAAYFYLFGVLAAEAVRSGRLTPNQPKQPNGHHNGSGPASRAGSPGTSFTTPQNVSENLQDGKEPDTASRRARVCLAGGADGPPLPKQPRRPS